MLVIPARPTTTPNVLKRHAISSISDQDDKRRTRLTRSTRLDLRLPGLEKYAIGVRVYFRRPAVPVSEGGGSACLAYMVQRIRTSSSC
jgi:hypothetical protein